jgi:glycosyltransferase involved in cell wall biosynthesis
MDHPGLRVALDIRYLSHGLTGGVHSYVTHLARELPRAAHDLNFIFYADAKAPLEVSHPQPDNVSLRRLPWSSPLSTIVNDVRIARRMAADGVRVAHFPANYGSAGPYRLVVTLHDTLNLFGMREHLRGFGRSPRKIALMLYLGRQTRRTLARADALITVSEYSRRDIHTRSGYPLERIHAVHSAADDRFRPLAPPEVVAARQRLDLPSCYVLADGIKNPGAVLAAFHALPPDRRGETGIVFFSREPTPRPEVRPYLADSHVRFLSQPDTDDLVALMAGATVFAFPSFYEGFGMPLVEAMRCGTPIVASSRGSIPEVLGGAGLLFDLEQPTTFSAHLADVLGSPAVRATLREASLRRARDFSWQETATRIANVYRAAPTGRLTSARHPSTRL